MGCCGKKFSPSVVERSKEDNMEEQTLLQIPGANVHLMANAEAVELAKGELAVVRIANSCGIPVAIIIRVGRHLSWPLMKDEPVVKLDDMHYIFTIPDKNGRFLNYGVSFAAKQGTLALFDTLLKENTSFSAISLSISSSKSSRKPSNEVFWKGYAPNIEDYNNALAKAIATGTGEVIRGIFLCNNTYSSQIQNMADLFRKKSAGTNMGHVSKSHEPSAKLGPINKSLQRVRQFSAMTEKMSQTVLEAVVAATGMVTGPLLQSALGKSLPGEVLLASMDAINKVMDAIEAAEKRSIATTSDVVAGAVSKRFGESAGAATEDVFAAAAHGVGTAWNLFKIRKALMPASSAPSAMLKNAVRKRN